MKKNSHRPAGPLRDGFERQLRSYSSLGRGAVASAAAATSTVVMTSALVVMTPAVEAQVVYTSTASFRVTYVGGANFTIGPFTQIHFFADSGALAISPFSGGQVSGLLHASNGVARLGTGIPILEGSGLHFGANSFSGHGLDLNAHRPNDFVSGGGGSVSGYVGVKLTGHGTYYGWLHVTARGDGRSFALTPALNSPYSAMISSDAISTPSAIPEPASVATGLALFALGAAGVREHRRRRQQAT